MLKGKAEDSSQELLQQVCDALVTGGYFRARLPI